MPTAKVAMRVLSCLGVIALWLWSGLALAQRSEIELGVLTCSLAEPAGTPTTVAPNSESQLRDALCTFKPTKGTEEVYAGTIQGVALSPDQRLTVIWRVKASATTSLVPGILQQRYAVDNATPADQLAPMIGESNSDIVLQSLTDKQIGSASTAQKPLPSGYVIIGLQLMLKSAAG
jgi:uncharacterized protein DUF992